jgi:hypothetical protein
MAVGLPAVAWQALCYWAGHKGPLMRQATLVPVWHWEEGKGAQSQGLHLLISREVDSTHVKYSLCYLLSPARRGSPERGAGAIPAKAALLD